LDLINITTLIFTEINNGAKLESQTIMWVDKKQKI